MALALWVAVHKKKKKIWNVTLEVESGPEKKKPGKIPKMETKPEAARDRLFHKPMRLIEED